MRRIAVIKRDANGREELRYSGILRRRADEFVCIDARFEQDDRDLGYAQLRRGDIFREYFYVGRWFNIFRVGDADGSLKGWYCNITRPAHISDSEIAADDLCLDLFVHPDGRALLLDEDDFAQLDLAPDESEKAWQAVAELREMIARRRPPFDEIRAATPDPGG